MSFATIAKHTHFCSTILGPDLCVHENIFPLKNECLFVTGDMYTEAAFAFDLLRIVNLVGGRV